MKTFKHKTKNITATQVDSNRYEVCENHESLPAWAVEDSCDWEKVVEKEYKIIERRANINPPHPIHKVQRLSDGELFSIGDIIEHGNSHKRYIITYIEPSYFGLIKIYCKEYFERGYRTSFIGLSGIQKVESPILTTEGGKEFFEGDECWVVNDNFDLLYTSFITKDHKKQGKVRAFSTREVAEEYILHNKPINLSLKEIRKIMPELPTYLYFRLTEKIK